MKVKVNGNIGTLISKQDCLGLFQFNHGNFCFDLNKFTDDEILPDDYKSEYELWMEFLNSEDVPPPGTQLEMFE